ncbi:hypothetical protein LZ30DRAFT_724179 [Colletotrichum cereale]|nr:hypothetical protein LZ30DRAFT_724179 [Colletotrichum cereale]
MWRVLVSLNKTMQSRSFPSSPISTAIANSRCGKYCDCDTPSIGCNFCRRPSRESSPVAGVGYQEWRLSVTDAKLM